MATRDDIKQEATGLDLDKLTERTDTAFKNCEEWRKTVEREQKEAAAEVATRGTLSTIWGAVSSVWSDEDEGPSESQKTLEAWCMRYEVYRQELERRKKASPEARAQVEAKQAEMGRAEIERRKQRQEQLEAQDEAREEAEYKESVLYKVRDAIASFVGFGAEQTIGERVAGYGRLLVVVGMVAVVSYLVYKLGVFGVGQAKRQIETAERAKGAIAAAYGIKGL